MASRIHAGTPARFFHSSDAYTVEEIGRRHVWLKMASPTIEALRQSFVACGSRLRIGHERGEGGELRELQQSPDAARHERPWLRSVAVDGKASFFGRPKGSDIPTKVEFSPDLTCIIGASMTGKSTLLDGLRVHVGAPLPDDAGKKDGELHRWSRQIGDNGRSAMSATGNSTGRQATSMISRRVSQKPNKPLTTAKMPLTG